jgi:hypothetical protein
MVLNDNHRSVVTPGPGRRWRAWPSCSKRGLLTFRHDPAAGSFPGLDVRACRPADAEAHRVLSTPPGGRFTGVLVAMRRDDTGAEVLRGSRGGARLWHPGAAGRVSRRRRSRGQ